MEDLYLYVCVCVCSGDAQYKLFTVRSMKFGLGLVIPLLLDLNCCSDSHSHFLVCLSPFSSLFTSYMFPGPRTNFAAELLLYAFCISYDLQRCYTARWNHTMNMDLKWTSKWTSCSRELTACVHWCKWIRALLTPQKQNSKDISETGAPWLCKCDFTVEC